jgi:quinol monooxygenase YgiN
MKYTLAKYTVRPEKIREVKQAISEFLGEIRQHEPRTLYLVYRGEDSATFYHLMCFENEAAERRHEQSAYNSRFVKKVYPNCVGRPEFTDLSLFSASRKQWVLQK